MTTLLLASLLVSAISSLTALAAVCALVRRDRADRQALRHVARPLADVVPLRADPRPS